MQMASSTNNTGLYDQVSKKSFGQKGINSGTIGAGGQSTQDF
jgi:hypothetical protein